MTPSAARGSSPTRWPGAYRRSRAQGEKRANTVFSAVWKPRRSTALYQRAKGPDAGQDAEPARSCLLRSVYRGGDAPDKCLVCNAPKERFTIFNPCIGCRAGGRGARPRAAPSRRIAWWARQPGRGASRVASSSMAKPLCSQQQNATRAGAT